MVFDFFFNFVRQSTKAMSISDFWQVSTDDEKTIDDNQSNYLDKSLNNHESKKRKRNVDETKDSLESKETFSSSTTTTTTSFLNKTKSLSKAGEAALARASLNKQHKESIEKNKTDININNNNNNSSLSSNNKIQSTSTNSTSLTSIVNSSNNFSTKSIEKQSTKHIDKKSKKTLSFSKKRPSPYTTHLIRIEKRKTTWYIVF